MIRWLPLCLLFSALGIASGCGRLATAEVNSGPADAAQVAQAPSAVPETPPAIRPENRPDRSPAQDSKHKDIKNPFLRTLMDALDQAEGGTAAEMELMRKTLRENDAIVDKAFRDLVPLMQRANTRKAAIRVTHQDPRKPVIREFKAYDPMRPKIISPAPTQPVQPRVITPQPQPFGPKIVTPPPGTLTPPKDAPASPPPDGN